MTTIHASAEVNDTGVIAFAFAYPGACGWGGDEVTALRRLRADISVTREWLIVHDFPTPTDSKLPATFDIEIVEEVPSTGKPRQCDSEGFFERDTGPFTDAEVAETKQLVGASRRDLLELIASLADEELDYRLVDDRRTIREILDHIALAEHWYLTRVDAPDDLPADWRAYPDDTFERMAAIRTDVIEFLDSLESMPEASREEQRVRNGERWSLSKVLRRFVWHELLHFKQLRGVVPKVENARTE